jgi:mono/diheme cytochrome c family protein
MSRIIGSFIFLGVVLLANAQETTIKRVPPRPTTAIDGKSLFQEYCAVCHGPGGKGGGPAAPALKTAPGDLTQIARKHGGKFPDERVMRVLQGEESIAAHGSQEMPIWGRVFANMGNVNMGQTRLHALVQYVEGLQAK